MGSDCKADNPKWNIQVNFAFVVGFLFEQWTDSWNRSGKINMNCLHKHHTKWRDSLWKMEQHTFALAFSLKMASWCRDSTFSYNVNCIITQYIRLTHGNLSFKWISKHSRKFNTKLCPNGYFVSFSALKFAHEIVDQGKMHGNWVRWNELNAISEIEGGIEEWTEIIEELQTNERMKWHFSLVFKTWRATALDWL